MRIESTAKEASLEKLLKRIPEQMGRLKAVRETYLTDAVLLGEIRHPLLVRKIASGLPSIALGKTDWMIPKSMNSETPLESCPGRKAVRQSSCRLMQTPSLARKRAMY